MLFHVTLTHTPDECPGFNPEVRARAMAAYPRMDEIAGKHGVVVREHYNAAPEHLEVLIVEAPHTMAIAMFLSDALPYKASCEVKAVVDRATMKQIMASMAPPT